MPMYPAGKAADAINAGSADAVAMNADAAIITTKSLTTAAGATYSFTINCSLLDDGTIPIVVVGNGSNSAGSPALSTVTVAGTQIGPGSLTVVIQNIHSANALNGTLTLFVLLVK